MDEDTSEVTITVLDLKETFSRPQQRIDQDPDRIVRTAKTSRDPETIIVGTSHEPELICPRASIVSNAADHISDEIALDCATNNSQGHKVDPTTIVVPTSNDSDETNVINDGMEGAFAHFAATADAALTAQADDVEAKPTWP